MPKIVAAKNDWLKLGYQTFSNHGKAGIVVEKLAQKLNVNKSSFYWHFKTKKDFIHAIVDFWVENETKAIIREMDKLHTPEEKFEALLKRSYKQDPYVDFNFYLKRFAREDKALLQLIDTINTERISYVTGLLIEMGIAGSEATAKAELLYKHLIGYHEMLRNKKQKKNYLEDVKKELQLFIQF